MNDDQDSEEQQRTDTYVVFREPTPIPLSRDGGESETTQ